MIDTGDLGWKVAMVLLALLCVMIGAAGTSIAYNYGIVKDLTALKSNTSAADMMSEADRHRIDDKVNRTANELELLRQTMLKQVLAVDRVLNYICYRDTGKPCPAALWDERP